MTICRHHRPARAPRSRFDRKYAGQGEPDQGFVLVVVLAILLLLAITAIGLQRLSRSETQVRAALETNVQLEVLADGIVRLTALKLTDRGRGSRRVAPVPEDGRVELCRDGTRLVAVRVVNTNGLININTATLELLGYLLTGLGLEAGAAERLAAAIVDFRDTDSVPLVGGAELADYRAAGRDFGPKNAPFDKVGEIDQVLGMTPELLTRLKPLLTVHASASILDARIAPIPLLAALSQGVTGAPADIDDTPQGRGNVALPPAITNTARTRSGGVPSARSFDVTVTVAEENRGQFTRRAIVDLSQDGDAGFQIKEWSVEHPPRLPPATWSGAHAACGLDPPDR